MISADTRVNLHIGTTPTPPPRPACPTCGHLHVVHIHDRRGRPICVGNAMCGCAKTYEPETP